MTKTKEPYRGEDRTLEMIRKRAEETGDAFDRENWNETCDKIAAEMEAEGLTITAQNVLEQKF